jgi:hypothetical protein
MGLSSSARRTNTIAGEIKEVAATADVLLLCRYSNHQFAEVAALKETYEFGGGILKSFDDVFAPCQPPVGDPAGGFLEKPSCCAKNFRFMKPRSVTLFCWMSRMIGLEKLAGGSEYKPAAFG